MDEIGNLFDVFGDISSPLISKQDLSLNLHMLHVSLKDQQKTYVIQLFGP